ncbi:MAG: hypothetical protein V1847_00265, partial [Candidatus Diapherotrites archaeon]
MASVHWSNIEGVRICSVVGQIQWSELRKNVSLAAQQEKGPLLIVFGETPFETPFPLERNFVKSEFREIGRSLQQHGNAYVFLSVFEKLGNRERETQRISNTGYLIGPKEVSKRNYWKAYPKLTVFDVTGLFPKKTWTLTSYQPVPTEIVSIINQLRGEREYMITPPDRALIRQYAQNSARTIEKENKE